MPLQKNNIELVGYIGAKPIIRFLPSGMKVASVRLAEGYHYVDAENKEQEHTNWHAIVCYGRLAEMIEHLNKGDNVLVNGTLQIREFTPPDGLKRRVYEVIARTVAKIDRRSNGDADFKDNNPHEQQPEVPSNGSYHVSEDGWPL
jgi:single-strand DNA-binding protein